MSTRGLLFQCWSSTKRTSLSSHQYVNSSRHEIAEQLVVHMALHYKHSLTNTSIDYYTSCKFL
jgi:hypothetical protein